MEASLNDQAFVVTGATSGIGRAVAAQLAERGAFLLGVGRSPERCAEAAACLQSAYPRARVAYCVADLSRQEEVRKLAYEIRMKLAADKVKSLTALVNNAGTFTYWMTLTPEGFEMQWAVNHLAAFLLTHELLPLLKAAPAGRVVTVSSSSHYRTKLRWNDIQLRRGYNCLMAYKQTKLANVLFTAELNRRLGPSASVRAFAADPGLVVTEMGFKGNPGLVRWIWNHRRRFGVTPDESAKGVVYVSTEASIQTGPEIYWMNGKPKRPSNYALDPDAARRLWDLSEQMCGLSSGTHSELISQRAKPV